MKYWTPERVDQIALVTTSEGLRDSLAAYAATGIDELALMFVNPPEQLPDLVRLVAASRPTA
jgi:alkanesulfonate monooxygenase SsuD/methylene tetrahydromethanopterin reductase-like flavin-dependent oxidoreductase (luciferase family)